MFHLSDSLDSSRASDFTDNNANYDQASTSTSDHARDFFLLASEFLGVYAEIVSNFFFIYLFFLIMLLCSLTSAVLICWASFEIGDNSLYHVENDAKGMCLPTFVQKGHVLFIYFLISLVISQ